MKPEAQTNSKLTDSPERRQDSAIAFSTNGLGASSIIEPDTISSVHRHAHHRHRHRHSPHHPPRSTAELVIKIVASVLLVLLAGLFSGLTIGIMGLDELRLSVLAEGSTVSREREDARAVLSLLERGRHWILVVLLLGNVIVSESLPVCLDSVVGDGLAAVIVSTVAIGAIIPQAFGVRHGLALGATAAPYILSLMRILSPIAYPMALLLDLVLGKHAIRTYSRDELKVFFTLHVSPSSPAPSTSIVRMLTRVLDMERRKVGHIMTPLNKVMSVALNSPVDSRLLKRIASSSFSRLPVHEVGDTHAFRGMLLVTTLLKSKASAQLLVSDLEILPLPEIHPSVTCLQTLNYFRAGRSHLLLVSRSPGHGNGALGIVTMDDVLQVL
ncbi:hypothetical protein BDV98DRAFT_514106 [Pterulicium gracile]|uniref:CNNM transmembrane domain-containing protein n=1 Tax=Pterulicium gracile TaxID=1884261 RepID=A0A5C3QAZ1_9AGAR|nr:hypothetical protein BDV98DRAFT_514106 [Pterula gracilis]